MLTLPRPEIKFTMDRLITYLMDRFKTRDHCLIVCAEGAGMDLLGESGKRDASGNKVFEDIGLFLKKEISARFKAASVEHTSRVGAL